MGNTRVQHCAELVKWAQKYWANAEIAEIEKKFQTSYAKAMYIVCGFRKAGYKIPKRISKEHPCHTRTPTRTMARRADYLKQHYANAPIDVLIKGLKVKTQADVFNIAAKCREAGYPIPFRAMTRLEIDPVTYAMFFDDREKMVGGCRKPVLADAIMALRELLLDTYSECYGGTQHNEQ